MIEVRGNLWTYPADVRVITTNGTIKKNGECVMGRGCAAEAKAKYPLLPKALGDWLRDRGNIPSLFIVADNMPPIVTFPVKHHWHEKADAVLIQHSAERIVSMINNLHPNARVIVMPRPGCGNGHLKWEDVRKVISPILDDRFHVITW